MKTRFNLLAKLFTSKDDKAYAPPYQGRLHGSDLTLVALANSNTIPTLTHMRMCMPCC